MNKKQLIEKIENMAKTYGKYGENIFLIQETNHGCRPQFNRLWQAYAVKIDEDSACWGKVIWDFEDLECYDEIDDAGNYPWDDETIMDFEPECGFDLTDDNEIVELFGMI